MIDWNGAARAIVAIMGRPVGYESQAWREFAPAIPAIRSDEAAPSFDGAGNTLRTVTYEIQMQDLALPPLTEGGEPRQIEPEKQDVIYDQRRLWRVEDITRRDDVGAWELIVIDIGEAP